MLLKSSSRSELVIRFSNWSSRRKSATVAFEGASIDIEIGDEINGDRQMGSAPGSVYIKGEGQSGSISPSLKQSDSSKGDRGRCTKSFSSCGPTEIEDHALVAC